ncbi:MAG: primosomal protein N' [Anaerolineae bacterium]
MTYVEVAVNAPVGRRPPGPLAHGDPAQPGTSVGPTFHYRVPLGFPVVEPGQLVRVPFGARELQAIVVGLRGRPDIAEIRDIHEISDPEPVLLPWQIELARWMSQTYLAPLIDCLLVMLPPGIDRKARTYVEVEEGAAPTGLDDRERAVFAFLESRGPSRLDLLPRRMRMDDARERALELVAQGLLVKRSRLERPRVRPRVVRTARAVAGEEVGNLEALGRAPRQKEVLAFLRGKRKPIPVSEVYRAAGGSLATLRRLEEKGLVEIAEREVWRDPLEGREFVSREPPVLTPDQDRAWTAVQEGLRAPGSEVFLLHGVTGSGKTEIYLRALAETVDGGGQAIVLVPEIALTPQTVRRFAARFGRRLSVVHSQLSLGERYDAWRRIRRGDVDLAIGSRSAIFSPFPRLRLIVVDEEHERTYKQQRSPRYHAREVGGQLAELLGATVILGSATPDLESYHRARQGSYQLLTLPQRIMGHRLELERQRAIVVDRRPHKRIRDWGEGYGEAIYMELPQVEVVDLRQELKAGNRGIFSRALMSALREVLQEEEQAILFLNRRGSATFVMCRDCGHVVLCPRCSIPLTYHLVSDGLRPGLSSADSDSSQGQLVCHHCNSRYPVPRRCPRCGSHRIRHFGIGTQLVEREVERLFPGTQVVRWDRDTTGPKGSHEAILDAFLEGQAQVMVGTQMIAKGLDLPLVTLVGVVTADTALHLPDFRAGERTFQLLTQVAGRAGRSILGGRVIIQTYTPRHYAVEAASRHDYEAFFEQEISFRREQGYPPLRRLVRLIHLSRSLSRAEEAARTMRSALDDRIARLDLSEVEVVGPAPAFYSRLRGRHRWHLLVKARDPHALLEGLPFGPGWRVDVDPVTVL